MVFFQQMQIAAKSGTSVTFGKIPGGTAPAAAGDGAGHPKYLNLDAMVFTTTNSPFDPTFFGCGATFKVEITRMST